MERQLNIELQAMNETLMAQIADHRREVDAIKADALDVSNQQRKQVADLQRQLEAERDVQQALTDIIAEERAKLEAAQNAYQDELRGHLDETQRALNLEAQVAQLKDWRADVTVALQRGGGAFYEDVPGHIKELVRQVAQLTTELDEAKEELVDAAAQANNVTIYKSRCEDLQAQLVKFGWTTLR